MKHLKRVFFTILLFSTCSVFAQTTTVWVVRHAEKDTAHTSDPDLSAAGNVRATDLVKELKKAQIKAVYTTPYKRTVQTGQLILTEAGLNVLHNYKPSELPALVKEILSNYAGQSVLIVGHSNTVIPTIEAFGAKKPVDALTDDDYDFLFKITIPKDGKASVETKHYGSKHHTTNVPQ